ncbi:MAG: MATE family efflux transporter [Pseudomonadota bacterium]
MMPASAAAATPTRGEVLRIATPLILSNLSVPLLGMVDTAVVGHMGEVHYLGAVAVGASVFSLLFFGLNFLRMATTGLVSQAAGAGEGDTLRVTLMQGVLVALVCATLLLLLQHPMRELAMSLLGVTAAVGQAARAYFDVRVWSAPLVLVNFVLVGWLVGLARTRAVLAVTLTINLANILLDLLFVYGLGSGIRGVAAATVLAELLGMLTAVMAARGALLDYPARHLQQWSRSTFSAAIAWRGLSRLFALNGNLLVRTLALQLAFLALTGRGARLGETILAVNAVLLTFQHVISYGLDGFAQAVEALVGRGLGARRQLAVEHAVRYGFECAVAVAACGALVLALGGGALADMLTDQSAVREGVRRYLPWLVVSPLISLWSFIFDGAFIGATAAREMRNAMVLSTFVVYLPALWLLADWGNHGLWAAFSLFMLARAITMAVAFPGAVLARAVATDAKV